MPLAFPTSGLNSFPGQSRDVSVPGEVEMSPWSRAGWRRVLELICPPGVAPERMPKAEATTGLAPKKASATSPLG